MEGVLPLYERAARDDLMVVRVHSGDPALWGAVGEQVARCEHLGLDVEIVPGVSAFTALAAIEHLELTVPEISQSVILTRLEGGKTPMPPGETVRGFAAHGTTMAIFLSAARSGVLQAELLAGGYPTDTPVIIGYQVTWPDELVVHCTVGDLAATTRTHKLWKHTLFLVGPGLGPTATRSQPLPPGALPRLPQGRPHGSARAEGADPVVNELASEPWASLLCRPNGVRNGVRS